ncbi:MAG: SpoIIE family protein phosphatase [Bacteroidetes bacterium]|nr:SpoIIE family protein phosphatase [Bacteroidota bacterium]
MFKKLINTGVHEGLTFKEQSKIRIFNSSLLTVAAILTLYTGIGLLQKLYFTTALTVVELLFIAVNFQFTHARKYNLSFHFGILNGLFFIFGFVFLLGEVNQTHLYFLFMPMAAMIVFDSKKTVLIYFALSMAILLFSFYIFKNYLPVYNVADAAGTFRLMNPLFTGLLIFLGIKLFKNENLEFNDKINQQKKLLEEKNKDITDSIQYAKRIQSALMASDNLLKKNLPEHFVLYKPKDIVSGDFYWAEKFENKFLLAVCDCTGHGVPGAFMSLLGISFLNEITKEKNITQPDLVFNALRANIINALNPEWTMEEGKDGMDAVLCNFDFTKKEVQFTCSNNPLWILRNNQWLEFKPDKFPIGLHGEIKPFTLRSEQLQKGDLMYMFTDGYADQFGGVKGKKFKYKNIQKVLLENSPKSMEEQKKILDDAIEKWKGNLEQVDDILIIGIRI